MLERIYIARHGFRVSWDSDHWTSSTGLERDPPLSAYGHEQARALARHLAEGEGEGEGEGSSRRTTRIDRIYSSPYGRCLQTARPISEALGKKVYVEHGIGEWYFPSRSRLPAPYPARELAKTFDWIDDEAYPLPILRSSLRGESIDDLHDRARHVLAGLIEDCDRKRGGGGGGGDVKTILLVTHAATSIALGRALTGERDRRVNVGCCSLSTYVRRPGREDAQAQPPLWTCEANGDTSFLVNGEERNWQFDDVSEYEEPGLGDKPDQSLAMWQKALERANADQDTRRLLLFEKSYKDLAPKAKY